MKKLYSLLLLLLFISTVSYAQAPTDSIKTYVVQALDIMKQHSINKQKVDWEKLYASTLEATKDAQTIRETYPALNNALEELGDRHSRFFPKEVFDAHNVGYKSLGRKLPMPSGHMIDKKYAFILVPPFYMFEKDEQLAYADSLQTIIRQLDTQNPKGWIIDLRLNDGGNMHPLLAGLAPILGEGQFIGWQSADNVITYDTVRNGMVRDVTGGKYFLATPYTIKNTKAPVSILVSDKTASSAEMIAGAFIGKPKTKLIGTYTGSLTTSNELYKLSDGSYLNLTVSTMVDRTGKVYGKGITPDIELNLTKNTITNGYLYIRAAINHIDKPKKK
ncbi:S41 family peptidase [Pontibacter populi]|uniref:S41 family peptidase n=1 Tax=Pontibacter populi TaxID=890055 RepID=A0ABV1RYA7_9BACT